MVAAELSREIGLQIALVGLLACVAAPGRCADPSHCRRHGESGVDRYGQSQHTPRVAHRNATAGRQGPRRGGIDPASGLDSAEVYDPVTETWSVTGRMSAPRAGHTATLLSNGRVLVAGGCGYLQKNLGCAAAELYDPAAGTWSLVGKLGNGVFGPTANATLLQSGRVLYTGGTVAAIAELYDPVTGAWANTGPSLAPRDLYTSTLLRNGRVLTAGGTDDSDEIHAVSTAELYDPATGIWNPTGNLNFNRASHTATLLRNGSVLAAGGNRVYAGEFTLTSVAELFDAATGVWTRTGNLNTGRFEHTATALSNGPVLVAGGYVPDSVTDYGSSFTYTNSVEIYDPISGTWQRTAHLNTGRTHHTATLLANGTVLVVGGHGLLGTQFTVLGSSELYDPNRMLPRTIDAAYTGSWFNPAQSGHGFMLEVLPGAPMQLLASWFAFAPEGGPSWIVGVGPIDGNQAAVDGFQSVGSGGRFPPNFDAANVHQESWGTLIFKFSDCNHGHVDWAPTAPGYGSGGMDLMRLTLPAGLNCSN